MTKPHHHRLIMAALLVERLNLVRPSIGIELAAPETAQTPS